ncbi:hypothetical protein GW17_00022889 [Ensete ventricosum]|nr:hypothetical protein GW17_00022889 [Ensete ventricosum]
MLVIHVCFVNFCSYAYREEVGQGAYVVTFFYRCKYISSVSCVLMCSPEPRRWALRASPFAGATCNCFLISLCWIGRSDMLLFRIF